MLQTFACVISSGSSCALNLIFDERLRLTDRQANTQADIQIDGHTDIQAYIYMMMRAY